MLLVMDYSYKKLKISPTYTRKQPSKTVFFHAYILYAWIIFWWFKALNITWDESCRCGENAVTPTKWIHGRVLDELMYKIKIIHCVCEWKQDYFEWFYMWIVEVCTLSILKCLISFIC